MDSVIITRQKTGSSYLTHPLSSAPDIVAHGELFDRTKACVNDNYVEPSSFADIDRFNESNIFLTELKHATPGAIVGLKMMPRQNDPLLWALIDNEQKKVLDV